MKNKEGKKELEYQSVFWVWAKRYLINDSHDIYIIETTNTKIIKDKQVEKCRFWYKWDRYGKIICIHIRTNKDSPEQKYLFKELGIKLKDRIFTDKD